MTKRRNAHAVDAWSRHGGAHDPGTKRPTPSQDAAIEEAVGEFLLDADFEPDEDGNVYFAGVIEVDGEELVIEFDWSEEEDDDE